MGFSVYRGRKVIRLKRLKDFPNYYITTSGVVMNERTVIQGSIANNGYRRVSLRKDSKTYYRNVHRLVAETFLIRKANDYMINHKDKNKLNNHVDNLEWCNHSHNNTHSRRGKRRGVTYEKRRNHFVANLWCKTARKPVYLGAFKSEKKAYDTYYKAYLEKYGVKPW